MEGTDGRYTVQGGDTLQSIAAAHWGDASLWYLIAEANGLSGAEYLAAGANLIIPDKVTNIHNRASTFEVYDPNRALGDLSPSTVNNAKPRKGNKCGVFGAILLVAIAVAVTVVTSGAALAALSPTIGSIGAGISAFAAGSGGFGLLAAAGAIGGAVGSAVSQGIGVATGLQDKFSWKGVAMAGISGGIGGGIGSVIKGAGFVAGAARGALGSAATQGIGIALGLQKKFDFAGVAAAGVGGGFGSAFGKAIGAGSLTDLSARNIAANLGTSAAGAIANAATRSLINGSDFGDNMLAALPDIIGSTVGNMIGMGFGAGGGAAVGGADTQTLGIDSRAEMLAAQAGEVMFGDMNAELDAMMAEWDALQVGWERMTNPDWEGSEMQAAHSQVRAAIHAQVTASLTGSSTVSGGRINGLTDNPNLTAMPTTIVNPTMSASILDGWEAQYSAAWTASAGKYDPFNHAHALRGFAANREYIAWLDRVADAQMAQDFRDFGRIYYDVASTVILPVGVADTGYRILSGQMTAAEAAVAVATLGRGRALRAADNLAPPGGAGRVFTGRTTWTGPSNGTGISYRVHQRNIDWDLRLPNGLTNREWAAGGRAPFVMKNGQLERIELHHSRQNANGPLFELSTSTHRAASGRGREALHPYGNRQHPLSPVDRNRFSVDRAQYWIDRSRGN